jgi:hypothetical protein
MKKLLFLLAVAGMISIVACKSKENKTDATGDTTVAQEQVDTTVAPAADTTQVK